MRERYIATLPPGFGELRKKQMAGELDKLRQDQREWFASRGLAYKDVYIEGHLEALQEAREKHCESLWGVRAKRHTTQTFRYLRLGAVIPRIPRLPAPEGSIHYVFILCPRCRR